MILRWGQIVVAVCLVSWACPEVRGQGCHDWDADGDEAGWQCAVATDCEDQAWQRNPEAADTCDGLDNDCDGLVDQVCDRFCEEPSLFRRSLEITVSGLPEAGEGCATLMDDGFLVASQRVVDPGPPAERLFYARAYDRVGTPWAPAVAPGEPTTVDPSERSCSLAGAGDRALFLWEDWTPLGGSPDRLVARVVDSRGRPMGPGPIDLCATSPVGSAPWRFQAPVWDGERFVVFWTAAGYRRNLLMSVIHRDGTVSTPTTNVVTDDVDGSGSSVDGIRAIWTGDHFIVVVNVSNAHPQANMNVLKISRDGLLLSGVAVPERIAQDFHMTLGGDRIFVVWDYQTAATFHVRAAFLDLDGNYLDPPGTIQLLAGGPISGGRDWAAWSGEMFAVAGTTLAFEGSRYVYTWRFWRVLPDGTPLDPGGIELAHDASLDDFWGLEWNGEDFWVFATRDSAQLFVRERVVCSCQDLDADLLDACAELDCDDGDPLVHPLATETCRGLVDDDCDGLVDCDDTADCPSGPQPGEVSDVAWNGQTLGWSAVPGAQRYDLARGLLSDLKRREDFRIADCPGLEISSSQWTDDGRVPPLGDVLWYLVRSEGAPCALGTWGLGAGQRDVAACR